MTAKPVVEIVVDKSYWWGKGAPDGYFSFRHDASKSCPVMVRDVHWHANGRIMENLSWAGKPYVFRVELFPSGAEWLVRNYPSNGGVGGFPLYEDWLQIAAKDREYETTTRGTYVPVATAEEKFRQATGGVFESLVEPVAAPATKVKDGPKWADKLYVHDLPPVKVATLAKNYGATNGYVPTMTGRKRLMVDDPPPVKVRRDRGWNFFSHVAYAVRTGERLLRAYESAQRSDGPTTFNNKLCWGYMREPNIDEASSGHVDRFGWGKLAAWASKEWTRRAKEKSLEADDKRRIKIYCQSEADD